MNFRTLAAFSFLFFTVVCHSAELKLFRPAQVNGTHIDTDIEFTLTPQEIATLNTNEAKAALLAFFTPTLTVYAPFATAYVSKYLSDIQSKSGRGGAWVKMTLRDQNLLHVWEVYGLQEKTVFSNPILNGLPVDGTTWDFQGSNEDAFTRLAASAYCRGQGYPDVDSYAIKDLSQPGAWRFDTSGQGRLCSFCRRAFASITCAR